MGERKKLDYDAFLARGAYDSFDIQYCLEQLIEADRAFQETDALLQATEDITGIDYSSQSDRFYRILDAYGKLRRFMNRYVEEVWDVDKEFYSAIANGPAEALSHVRLEDIKIPNTLGLSNHDARAGTDIPLSHLSIKNFIREPEALNNNYVRGFAELFQEDVEMAGETMTLKEFLEELENAAAYSNDIHKPWLEALSVLLNMASFGVKPLYECICGYDIITGEQLSTGERVWTGVEAVLDFLPVFGVAKVAEQGLVKALGAETVNGIEAQLRGGVVRNAVEGGSNTRVFTSDDPLVGDVATQIEQHLPGRITSVNRVVNRPDGSILTDLDIELDNIVIQVKTGGGKKLTKQLINSVNSTGKIAIGYVPDIKPSVLKEATNNGFQVFTNIDDLIEFISQH